MCVCAFLPWCAPPPFAARRGEVSLAGCSGGRRLCAAPRGVVVVARRSEVPLAGCSGGGFFRYTPRGMLRCRGARGALRPLFLLRSCAADQEKRPEKKSWAVIACALVRLERLWGTCIRSASRCSSRWQRGGRNLLAAWERFWGWIWGWVCGACAVRWGLGGMLPRKPLPSRCAARGVALVRGPRGAAAAFLASLMRR